LWHWPLLAYARISVDGEPPAAVRLALLATSFVLAWLTYELIEKKIRFARRPSVKRLSVPALGAAMAVVGVAGLAVLQSRVLPQSASIPLVNEISRASLDWGYKGDQVIPGDSPRTVLFLGDSHMQQYWARIEKLLAEHAAPVRTIVFKTVAGCAPVPGIERRSVKCSQFVDEGLAAAMRPEVETVVIAGSWVGFLSRGDYYRIGDVDARPLKLLTPETDWVMEGFRDALARLVRAGKRVVIVLSSPRGEMLDPKSVIERDGMAVRVRGPFAPLPRAELAALTGRIDARLKAIAQAAGATVIDPADWLCTASSCPAADEAGRPLYRDAALDGEAHQPRHVADAELFHQPRAVGLDGLLRERQTLGDLRPGVALGEKLQHFALARRQARQRIVALVARVVVDHHVGDARAEVALPRVHRADRLDHLLRGRALHHVARGARLERAAHVFALGVHRQHDDPALRIALEDRARGIGAVQLRHGEIHEHHVGGQLARQAQRLAAVHGERHHLHVGLRLHHVLEPFGHHPVVIGNDDADRHG